jgi:crotonobetainyl-CoA:carnitine CoA-transferase CaiB-like acyl-CoA transferase
MAQTTAGRQQTCLSGLVVADLGLGMAAALVAKYLREAGAALTRVEPEQGDPFYQVYAAYQAWHRGSTNDPQAGSSAGRHALLSRADIAIVGGEDFPGIKWRQDAAALQARYPRLVVLDLQGYPNGTAHAGRPATDLLVQARSGLAAEHYSKRPIVMGFEPSNYGAAMHGLVGLFTALYQRESTGCGQVVTTSLLEGALSWPLFLWVEATRGTPASNFVMPKDPWPLIFKCSDGKYVQIVLGSAGSKYKLYKILNIDDPTVGVNDSGMPQPSADMKNFFGNIDLLAAHVAKQPSKQLIEAIWAAGLPAEPVMAPGECWDDAQVLHNEIIVRDTDGLRHVGHPITYRASPAPKRATLAGALPLSGIRILDLGAFVAGPYASTLLVDLGADVIKVEPMTGDPNRAIFRSFTSVSRGKRCIGLDLKAPEGLKIAQQLCLSADVVTSNFRPGVSARLGVDAPTLHKLKPELIVVETSAYGASGPRAEGAGFDMCFQALCGHDVRAGGIDNAPLWNRTSMVDFAAGLLGGIAVVEALYCRARTGAGAEMGTGLLNAGLYLLSDLIQRRDGQFTGAPLLNHEQTGYHPAEQLYQARDAWIAIAARDEAMAKRLVDALDLSAAVKTPRAEWDAAAATAIAAAIKTRSASEWLAILERAEVWAEACVTNGEAQNLHDTGLEQLDTVYVSEHPQFGTIRQIGPLVRLSGVKARPAPRHAPLPGEHTADILADIAYSASDIASLRERKIIR